MVPSQLGSLASCSAVILHYILQSLFWHQQAYPGMPFQDDAADDSMLLAAHADVLSWRKFSTGEQCCCVSCSTCSVLCSCACSHQQVHRTAPCAGCKKLVTCTASGCKH